MAPQCRAAPREREAMIRRIPVLSTLIVLAAVATMIGLGLWQLDRLKQKESLLARYAIAQRDARPMDSLPLNQNPADFLYRHVITHCSAVVGWRSMAGRNQEGSVGIAHIALCKLDDRVTFDGPGYDVAVAIGWSSSPRDPNWHGGLVTGVIAPFGKRDAKVVADPPLAGLRANAPPDPADIPNNHLSYAVQWFLFAATALVIYALALRKRLAAPPPPG
jgi:surfeit locus 1 family protein